MQKESKQEVHTLTPENLSRAVTSPTEVLIKEFIEPLGMAEVAKRLHMTYEEVVTLVACPQVTPTIANTLAQLGTTPEFWINLQTNYWEHREAVRVLESFQEWVTQWQVWPLKIDEYSLYVTYQAINVLEKELKKRIEEMKRTEET